ncbi:hypothetical protein [Bartonella sp. B17]
MSSLIFVLLLVSCTDDFTSCYSNETMVKTYPTAQACDQALEPSVQRFASYGEQVFAQCTSMNANLPQEEANLTWTVTNRGNFLIKNHNIDNSLSTDHTAEDLPSAYPLLHKVRIE